MSRTCMAACLLISSLIIVPAHAAPGDDPKDNCATPQEIHFARGSTSTVVNGVVTRDAAHCYVISARKGQLLDVAMTEDSSSNAAMLAFRPGWGFRDVHGYQLMDGDALPGAGRDDEAHSVSARLPQTGRYLIEMATARGDAADYGLRISVR